MGERFNYIKLTSVVQKQLDARQSSISSLVSQQIVPSSHLIQERSSSKNIQAQDTIEEEAESPKLKTKKIPSYQLIVSESSSDNSLSMSPVLPRRQPKQSALKGAIMHHSSDAQLQIEHNKATQNLKLLIKKKDPANSGPFRQQATLTQPPSPKSSFMRSIKEDIIIEKPQSNERRQINFLKSLNQNTNLKETSAIEEYYQNGKIVVNMHSKDLLTFVRLQHEVDELKRKQEDFNEQKERHFNLAKKEQELLKKKKQEQLEQGNNKSHASWWVGISLAKKFLRKGRKSHTQDVRFSLDLKELKHNSPNTRTSISQNPQPRLSGQTLIIPNFQP